MDPLEFLVTALSVSVTGALAPGPLLAVAVALGIRGGVRAGLLVALGHATVELPLVLGLGAGLIGLEAVADSGLIAILGGIGLFAFALIQLRAALRGDYETSSNSRYGAYVAGIALSAFNPFFLAWWATVGLKLVSDSLVVWPLWGPQVLFAIHIPLDFVWLGVMAALASRSRVLWKGRTRLALDIGLAVAMAVIGVTFVLDALA